MPRRHRNQKHMTQAAFRDGRWYPCRRVASNRHGDRRDRFNLLSLERKTMRPIRAVLLASLSIPALALAAPAAAQDVQYETATRVDFAGGLGTAMRIASRLGGGSTESVETTYIKGRRMRTDSDQSSTILNLDDGRITVLDHTARTYTTYTFEEMVNQARAAAAEANRSSTNGQEDAQARLDFRFDVDATSERQRVAGYDAQRVFLTMEAAAEAVPEGQTEMEDAGRLVVLTDMWTSRDIPILQARSAFEDASAQQAAEAGAALTEGFAAAFADDPRMRVAFEQSMEEARKIEGMAVKSVTHFVSVAPGQQFNRAAITNPEQGPSLAQRAAQQGARAAVGGLMGRLGGRRAPEPEPAAEAEPTQVTIFTVTSEVRNVRTGNVDASLFEVPAGYTQQAM